MFESKLKKISKEIFEDKNLKEYFILTNKKHKREMYFQLGNKKALNFAKPKFNSKKKKLIFFLLKVGTLQPFLKKIMLSEEIGETIFTGGQIKGFDLNNKIVNSFPHIEKNFIKSKKEQQNLSKKDFAPKIIKIDEKSIFSREVLLSQYSGNSSLLFNRLLEFYKTNKMTRKKAKNIKKEIKLFLKKNKIEERIFDKALIEIKNTDVFLFTKIHGEFAKEQCLINDEKIYFVDWDLREGLITEDLVNFFRLDENYFYRKEFKTILKKYPLEVRKNIKKYLILTELLRVIQTPLNIPLSKQRIGNILNQ